MSNFSTMIRRRIDRAGVLLSTLCLIHCLAGLVLVSVLGLGGGALLNPRIHEIGLALAVVIGAIGLGMGAGRGRAHHGGRAAAGQRPYPQHAPRPLKRVPATAPLMQKTGTHFFARC